MKTKIRKSKMCGTGNSANLKTEKVLGVMNDKNILEASKKVRSSQRNNFLNFMNENFPKNRGWYTSKDYATEWAGRFNSGSPERYMDSKSLKIYEKIKR